MDEQILPYLHLLLSGFKRHDADSIRTAALHIAAAFDPDTGLHYFPAFVDVEDVCDQHVRPKFRR